MSTICLTETSKHKRNRIAILRQKLAELFEKRENMVSFEKDALTTAYTMLIGKLLYEEFSLNVHLSKLKRTSELLQAKRNRGEQVIIEDIQRQVEQEFAEFQAKLEEQKRELQAAQQWLTNPVLDEAETAELKSIYRLLVKRLHPDWNPDLTEQEREMFVRAQTAYKMGDLQELRNILLVLEKAKPDDELNLEDTDKQIESLEKSLEDLQAKIDQLNKQFPFTYRERINNEDWVKKEQEKIKRNIDALKTEVSTWETYLASQMGLRTNIALS